MCVLSFCSGDCQLPDRRYLVLLGGRWLSGLSVKRSSCSLPETSSIRLLQQLLDQAAAQDLEKVSGREWRGDYEDKAFSVFLDEETGRLQKIEVPAYSLTVEFLEFTAE